MAHPTGNHGWYDAGRWSAALAVCALGFGLVACRSAATPPSDEGAPTEAPAVVITGACAEPRQIVVPAPAEGDAWQRVALPDEPECFEMSAESADAAGVAVDASFELVSSVELAADDVGRLLSVEPAVPLQVTEADAGSFRVVPEAPLAEGTVYRFALRDAPGGAKLAGWAFQTRAPLRVVQTLPEDQSSAVPLDTGVEITFSHDGVTGAEEAFSIEPEVAGRFETHGRTIVFVPEALAPETLYTVRLAPAVTVADADLALDEPFAMQFETGVEERDTTAASIGPALRFSRAIWEQPTADAPVLSLFSTTGAPDAAETVPVTVYRYADIEDMLQALDAYAQVPTWAYAARSAYRADTAGLAAALTFEAELQPLGDFGEVLLPFPDAVEAGFYLVEAEVEGGPVQAWLQVTDVGTYVAMADGRTLVWVNDVASGRPVEGAEVRLGDEAVETDAEGIVLVETPDDMVTVERDPYGGARTVASGDLVVFAPDGGSAVIPVSDVFRSMRQPGYRDFFGGRRSDLYWRYLYPDRQLYRLTDEVRFWGVARQRDGGAAVESVTVELRGGPYPGMDYQEPVVARAEVPVGPTGTFLGALPFSGAAPGFYTLRSLVGEDELSRTGIELRDFVTPAYRIDVEARPRAVYAGDSISVEVRAAFFEGSPVPGLALRVEGDTSATVETDAAGTATLAYEAPSNDTPYGYGWSQVYARPARPEEGQMSGMASVVVVPGAVALEVEAAVVGDTGVLSGTAYGVDLARVNEAEVADPTKFRSEPIAGQALSAEVVELVHRPVQIGTAYDFVRKTTVPTYRYDTEEVPLGTFEGESDANGAFRLAFPAAAEGSYRATLRATDADGRTTSRELYVGPTFQFGPAAQVMLDAETTGPYGIGDPVALRLRLGDEALPEGDRYLFVRARNGILDHVLETEPRFAFSFAEEHVPNVHVLGVRFTGQTYQEAPWSYSVPFDSTARELEVSVATDRPRYAPGDEVTLDVTAADPSGTPVAATVLLSAVDAAIVQLQGGGTGSAFRTSLYESVGSGVVRTYASHQYPLGAPGAEGGGGGDGRSDFQDVVLFEEVATDADGRASVTFRVPDNLTSWAITALALTEDLYAGTGLGEVPVGIPLFVDLTMNDSYLVADEPIVRLRAYGEGLAEGDGVTFELSSETLLAEPISVEGEAFVPVDVELPALVEGHHELRVTVTSGELFDALVEPLTVVPSRFLSAETRTTELESGAAYEPAAATEMVGLVVSDANRGRYYDDLTDLAWSSGDRLDQRLARAIAVDLLSTHFTATLQEAAPVRPEVYQTQDGGAALLPYGDADLGLSAQVASAAPNALGRQGLVSYFTTILDDAEETRERKLEALFGLASLGEPVLPDVAAALAAPGIGPRAQLQLGLAALALGDDETAGQVYRAVLAELGEQRGSRIRIDVGTERDASLEASLLAARLGAGLGDDTAAGLYAYAAQDTADDIVLALLEADYLQAALPRLAATPATLAYERFGAREERALAPGETLALQLTPDELSALGLEVVEGRVLVAATSLVAVEPAALESDPAVSVNREYGVLPATGEAAGEPTTSFTDGDLVRVALDYALEEESAAGCYRLSDLLPSGLRAVTGPYDPSVYYEGVDQANLVFPYDVVGQRVSFCVYRDGDQEPLSYLARVVTKGTYAAEPALLQSMEVPASRALSSPAEVTIR